MRCAHRLLDRSPDYAAPVFALTLHAYGDSMLIRDKIVGERRSPTLELAPMDCLSANNEFDATFQAWTQVINRDSWLPFMAVRSYLERLLSSGRHREARAFLVCLDQPGIVTKPANSELSILVFNGGFEQPPIGTGFDSSLEYSPDVFADFADSKPFLGTHCPRVDFPVSQNGEFEPVYEVIAVVPNQTYSLSAYVRSGEIASDSGPRLQVTDPACSKCLNSWTDITVGSTPWYTVMLKFSAGPQTPAVRISVWCQRSRTFPMDSAGSIWLDSI